MRYEFLREPVDRLPIPLRTTRNSAAQAALASASTSLLSPPPTSAYANSTLGSGASEAGVHAFPLSSRVHSLVLDGARSIEEHLQLARPGSMHSLDIHILARVSTGVTLRR